MASNKKNNQTIPTNISQESMQYLGLSKQPFMSEILSDEHFFKIPALEKITENLIHQVQFSELLLIVEGLQGSGKTALFRRFIQSEIPNIKLLSIQAEATDTLVQTQQKMSLHMQDLGDANHLDDNLKSLQMFDQTPLIVMDNSHVLSDTTLQELFRYQQQLKSEHDVNLKILLFANVGMTETLQNITDIPPERMYVQHIPEYTAKQANDFIMFRLANAGYSGEVLLTEHDFELLLKKSIATPVNLMKFAAPSIDKHVKSKIKPTGSGLKNVLLAVLVIAGLSVAGFAYFYFTQQSDTVHENLAETEAAEIYVSPPEGRDEQDLIEQETFATIPPDEVPDEDSIEIIEETPDITESQLEPQQESLIDETQAQQAKLAEVQQPIQEPALDDVVLPEEPETSPIEKVIDASIKKTSEQNTEQVIQTEPVIKPTVKKPAKPQNTSQLHPALKQLNAIGIHNSLWIKQQPASAWTLQLIGAREPTTLLKFVRKYPLRKFPQGSNLAWYKTLLKGKAYYVLIHGSYPGRDTARASIAELPAQLQAMKPWVKSIKSVQLAIK